MKDPEASQKPGEYRRSVPRIIKTFRLLQRLITIDKSEPFSKRGMILEIWGAFQETIALFSEDGRISTLSSGLFPHFPVLSHIFRGVAIFIKAHISPNVPCYKNIPL
jgi:hypothetical protein